jgi:hypothetical protein
MSETPEPEEVFESLGDVFDDFANPKAGDGLLVPDLVERAVAQLPLGAAPPTGVAATTMGPLAVTSVVAFAGSAALVGWWWFASPKPEPPDLNLDLNSIATEPAETPPPLETEAPPEPIRPAAASPEVQPKSVGRSARTRTPEAVPSAQDLLKSANLARREGDHTAAVRDYTRLERHHRGTREEITARVSRARLELDALKLPGRALAHFDAYLDALPDGTLGEEARLGRAVALGRLGRASAEAAAWRALLEHHPRTVHAKRAHDRLETLARP